MYGNLKIYLPQKKYPQPKVELPTHQVNQLALIFAALLLLILAEGQA